MVVADTTLQYLGSIHLKSGVIDPHFEVCYVKKKYIYTLILADFDFRFERILIRCECESRW